MVEKDRQNYIFINHIFIWFGQLFDNLKSSIKKVLIDIKKNDENLKKHVILFSPAAASFDSFKNFEDRGNYFNHLIKGMVDVK